MNDERPLSFDFDLTQYLNRINYSLPNVDVSLETLKELHKQHYSTIPFENIDIHLGKTISIEEKDIFDKIVTKHRGGYCFEMNGLFQMVLKKIGFDFVTLAARVLLVRKNVPRTHMVIVVHLNGTKWLCDVGFGSTGIMEPIPLTCDIIFGQTYAKYLLIIDPIRNEYLLQRLVKDEWQDCYSFTEERFHWNYDYIPANWYCSTSPSTWFVHKMLCTLVTPTAKFILQDDTLSIKDTVGGNKEIKKYVDRLEFIDMLEKSFGIVLPRDSQFKSLKF